MCPRHIGQCNYCEVNGSTLLGQKAFVYTQQA